MEINVKSSTINRQLYNNSSKTYSLLSIIRSLGNCKLGYIDSIQPFLECHTEKELTELAPIFQEKINVQKGSVYFMTVNQKKYFQKIKLLFNIQKILKIPNGYSNGYQYHIHATIDDNHPNTNRIKKEKIRVERS